MPPGFADDAVGRTGEITDLLATRFGPYPFEANGAIVDDHPNLFTMAAAAAESTVPAYVQHRRGGVRHQLTKLRSPWRRLPAASRRPHA